MKSLKIIAVTALVLPVLVFGQTATTTLPNPGLTPDSPFYFLNRVSEALQEFFTFNPTAKARLELQFSAERISEIKLMLETKGATEPGIDTAKRILNENLAKASEAVTSEKEAGRDVTELAKEVSEKITSQKLTLSGVFGERGRKLTEAEKAAREQLKAADNAGDAAKAAESVKNLSDLANEKASLKKHRDSESEDFDSEDNKVDSVLELKDQAQNAINDAKKHRVELMAEIPTLTVADLALADKAIASAEDLFAKENFQAAKELAKQAVSALERAKDANERDEENEFKGDTRSEDLMKKYEDRGNATSSQSGDQSLSEQKRAAEQSIRSLNADDEGAEKSDNVPDGRD